MYKMQEKDKENMDVTIYSYYQSNPKFNFAHNIVTSNLISSEMQLQEFINLSRSIKGDVFFIQIKRETSYISVNWNCHSVSLILTYFTNNSERINIHSSESRYTSETAKYAHFT